MLEQNTGSNKSANPTHSILKFSKNIGAPGVSEEVFKGFLLLRNLLKILMFQLSHCGKHGHGRCHALPALCPGAPVKGYKV